MNQKDLHYCRGGDKLPRFFDEPLRLIRLCLVLLLLSLALPPLKGIALAQEMKEAISGERIIVGAGVIVGENVARARNEAISGAFLKAIEEYLVQRLGSEVVAANFQRLDEGLLTNTREAVQDYEIISEFRTERYVKILMKLRVNRAVVEKKLETLGLLDIETVQIDVLFMVSEKQEGIPPVYWWSEPTRQTSLTQTELFLSRVFEGRGFRVINRSFFPAEEHYDESMLNPTLSNEAAAKWGRLLSAQIVITGETNLRDASGASVFLRAIKVMDETIVAQGYREEVLDSNLTDERSALELAINNWTNDMVSYIVDSFKSEQKALNRLIVIVKGLKGYGAFLSFKEFLQVSFPEITSVLERRINKNAVEFSVELRGDARKFASRLLNHPERPFSFDIDEVSDQGFTVGIR